MKSNVVNSAQDHSSSTRNVISKSSLRWVLGALAALSALPSYAEPFFSVLSEVCAYDRSVVNATNCSTNSLFRNVTFDPTSSTSFSGRVNGPGNLSIAYLLQGESSPGLLRDFARTISTGSANNWVASANTISTFGDSLTITAPGRSGSGTVLLGFRLSGTGTTQSVSAGAAVQEQLWYYVGGGTFTGATLLNITNRSIDTSLVSAPISFTYGQPFDILASVTARVDSYCENLGICGTFWMGAGTSDISHTLQLTSLGVQDVSGAITNFTVNAGSGSGVYNNLARVPEPSTGLLLGSVLLLLVGRGRRHS
jgi:hypothetical protein